MFKLEMLPAGPGDCLWLEYGTPPETRVVIIDGGLGKTAAVLRRRIEAACYERGTGKLELELLVVTHIDNDHILGIVELLDNPPECLSVKDVWFNGLPQLKRLPTPTTLDEVEKPQRRARPADLLGGGDDEEQDESFGSLTSLARPSDLLGPAQGDQLTELLSEKRMPWNKSWDNKAVMIPITGDLPTRELEGKLKLTILGPTHSRLYTLCTKWPDVLGGNEDTSSSPALPEDLLGPSDTWPPVWKEGEKKDSSFANGSSIMLLAEYGEGNDKHALLLAGDGHAPDIAQVMKRLAKERNLSTPFPLYAFKLPHHGSSHNLTQALLESVDCSRYLISTDGSGKPRHPDHQALLRILKYSSSERPHLLFNHRGATTSPWLEKKADVVHGEFKDFDVTFPDDAEDGLILTIK